jgi:hypothetical protein
MLFISFVPMDRFCKANAKTDLVMLHYVIFIELLVVFSMDVMSFDPEQLR